MRQAHDGLGVCNGDGQNRESVQPDGFLDVITQRIGKALFPNRDFDRQFPICGGTEQQVIVRINQ